MTGVVCYKSAMFVEHSFVMLIYIYIFIYFSIGLKFAQEHGPFPPIESKTCQSKNYDRDIAPKVGVSFKSEAV